MTVRSTGSCWRAGTGTGGAGELARRGVRTPIVLIDSATPYPGFTTIGPDAAEGIDAVVDHLLRVHDHPSVSLIIGDTVDATPTAASPAG